MTDGANAFSIVYAFKTIAINIVFLLTLRLFTLGDVFAFCVMGNGIQFILGDFAWLGNVKEKFVDTF